MKKAQAKPIKLSDGGGLFLLIQPNDKKYWRLAYRFNGKQKTLALGVLARNRRNFRPIIKQILVIDQCQISLNV